MKTINDSRIDPFGLPLSGSISHEVGDRAGVVLSVNPYVNVSLGFGEGVFLGYGIRAGLSGCIGAELYIRRSTAGVRNLVIK
jgi:hypothetical protein